MQDGKPRILVVDDFETVRMVFIKCLNELGIDDIEQAEDGKMAWEALIRAQYEQRPFDIIFCDWNMPEVSGLDLLNMMRADAKFKEMPFVMVTANADETSVVYAMRAGVSEYLVKPFDTRSLGRTLQRVVNRLKKAAA